MPVMLVRNNTPGPLILVDERGGDRQEYKWQPNGDMGDVLEVPDSLASSMHFRRVVQKGHLAIERQISDEEALMGLSDENWIRQQALGSGQSVPDQVLGETRTADGVPVIMDKEATAPISTMTLDENGDIVNVDAPSPEERQQQRGRQTPQPEPEPAGVAPTAGGHLDPNQP